MGWLLLGPASATTSSVRGRSREALLLSIVVDNSGPLGELYLSAELHAYIITLIQLQLVSSRMIENISQGRNPCLSPSFSVTREKTKHC